MRFTLGFFLLVGMLATLVGPKDSWSAESIRLITFNLGTARFRGLAPDCPNFKLCDPAVIAEAKALFRKAMPDVVMLQEVQGANQLIGNFAGGPVLPAGYRAKCVPGHAGVEEVCLAWNSRSARLAEACKSVREKNSGAVRCSINVRGHRADFVTVHPYAHDPLESSRMLNSVWRDLIREDEPTVLGGDFNTSKCTGFDGCSFPYPAQFGTLFGYHVAHYGRFSPKDTFYGNYQRNPKNGELKAVGTYSTIYRFKLDHLFVNFGETAEQLYDSEAALTKPCPEGVSTSNRLKFAHPLSIGHDNGWRADHFPILSCIHAKE